MGVDGLNASMLTGGGWDAGVDGGSMPSYTAE